MESKMNTKIDGLHSLKGQPKIVESYEELDQRLQLWYLEKPPQGRYPKDHQKVQPKEQRWI